MKEKRINTESNRLGEFMVTQRRGNRSNSNLLIKSKFNSTTNQSQFSSINSNHILNHEGNIHLNNYSNRNHPNSVNNENINYGNSERQTQGVHTNSHFLKSTSSKKLSVNEFLLNNTKHSNNKDTSIHSLANTTN